MLISPVCALLYLFYCLFIYLAFTVIRIELSKFDKKPQKPNFGKNLKNLIFFHEIALLSSARQQWQPSIVILWNSQLSRNIIYYIKMVSYKSCTFKLIYKVGNFIFI